MENRKRQEPDRVENRKRQEPDRVENRKRQEPARVDYRKRHEPDRVDYRKRQEPEWRTEKDKSQAEWRTEKDKSQSQPEWRTEKDKSQTGIICINDPPKKVYSAKKLYTRYTFLSNSYSDRQEQHSRNTQNVYNFFVSPFFFFPWIIMYTWIKTRDVKARQIEMQAQSGVSTGEGTFFFHWTGTACANGFFTTRPTSHKHSHTAKVWSATLNRPVYSRRKEQQILNRLTFKYLDSDVKIYAPPNAQKELQGRYHNKRRQHKIISLVTICCCYI